MAIHYDFIAFCSRRSLNSWNLGMRAVQGEVPLDIVLPEQQMAPNPDAPDEGIVGVLTTEGTVQESTDGLELVHYLRQLNPKSNDAFGYNEVVIRNIHSRLSTLKVDEEIRVQITYTERKGHYTPFLYHIKLLGIFGPELELPQVNEVPQQEEAAPAHFYAPQAGTHEELEKSPYKTTNTLEKLIAFTQNLQRELTETQKTLALTVEKVQQLEEDRQHHRKVRDMVQEILEHLNQLETLDERVTLLEADRQHIQALQQTLETFLQALHQQTEMLMKKPYHASVEKMLLGP